MQRICKEYYKQVYANRSDNLEEVDKFLEAKTLSRLNQDEIENLYKLTNY